MIGLWILPAVSGLLLVFAYPPYNLEFLVWAGFVPLFYYSVRIQNYKTNFFSGFLAGFIYFAVIMRWFWSVYPLDWAGIESKFLSFLLIMAIWLISAAGMAIWWGFTTFVAQIKNLKIKKYQLLVFPAVFTLSEYARSWFFGLLWAGSGTLWGPHWTLGNLAYALHNNSLFLKLSSFIGIYGITFLIVLINILILMLIRPLKIKNLAIAGLVIILITLTPRLSDKFLPPVSPDQEKIPVAVIQTKIPSETNYPPEKQLDDFKKQLNLLKEAAGLSPQPKIIIFPEGSNLFKNLSIFLDTKEVKNFFEKTFLKSTLIIDNSRVIDEEGRAKSRIIYIDSEMGALGFYDKRFLTPGGEFIPYHLKFIISIFSKNWSETFSQVREFSKGKKIAKTVALGDIETGTLICSGIFSNSIFKNLSKQNPDFFIILASTGIFEGNEDLLRQNLAVAKFRAVENNKYIVLAANYGNSYVVSNTGKLEKITPNKDWQLFTAEVMPQKEQTWYNKLGDIPLLILIFSTTLINVAATKRRSF